VRSKSSFCILYSSEAGADVSSESSDSVAAQIVATSESNIAGNSVESSDLANRDDSKDRVKVDSVISVGKEGSSSGDPQRVLADELEELKRGLEEFQAESFKLIYGKEVPWRGSASSPVYPASKLSASAWNPVIAFKPPEVSLDTNSEALSPANAKSAAILAEKPVAGISSSRSANDQVCIWFINMQIPSSF